MNQRAMFVWMAALALLFGFIMLMNNSGTTPATQIPVSQFIAHIDEGRMVSAEIEGPNISGVLKDEGGRVRTYATERGPVVSALVEHDVEYREVQPDRSNETLMLVLKLGIPLILVIIVFRAMRNAAQGQRNMMSNVSSHKGTLAKERSVATRFTDVAGIDEAVDAARDIVDFLKRPQDYGRLGARVPKGVLLAGPPGTGKTLLARAVAGESGVPFIAVSGSSFIEMFVGVGASRVRDLFKEAQKNAPCIVFIDELDAIGKKRGGLAFGGGNDEREQTLNEILACMDGFTPGSGIIIMAASNRPDVLDSALTRPGRFDRTVHVPPPDVRGREAILRVHSRKVTLAPDVDLTAIARGTPGMTGADLEGLLNEAAIIAGKLGKSAIDQGDLEAARDRSLMGPERRSAVLSEREKRIVAYHESGHAITGWFTPDADPVHRVSIVPRGMALGVTQSLPAEDRRLNSKNGLLAMIHVLLGGRAAEELAIGDITTGASDDLSRATGIAEYMITQVGMTEVGLRTFGKRDQGYLAYDYAQRDYGDETAMKIDVEIDRIVREAYASVKGLLEANRAGLDAMAEELLLKETLTAEDMLRLLGPRPGHPAAPSSGNDDRPAS